jgi:hypothetical protein
MLNPVDLVLNGKISVRINHWHWPHAQAHPVPNIHTNPTKMIANDCGRCTLSYNPYRRIIELQPASWITHWVLYTLHPYYIKMEWWLIAITVSKSIFNFPTKINYQGWWKGFFLFSFLVFSQLFCPKNNKICWRKTTKWMKVPQLSAIFLRLVYMYQRPYNMTSSMCQGSCSMLHTT